MSVVIRKSKSKDTLELSRREGGRSKGIKGEMLKDRTMYFLSLYSYHLIAHLTEQVLRRYIVRVQVFSMFREW